MVSVGIAYSGYAAALIEACPEQVDFVEVPFELLRHDPLAPQRLGAKPIILHCASLNIAGPVRPDAEVLDSLRTWIQATRTPWVGEHLAFTTTATTPANGDEEYPGQAYNIGFTVSPPMNSATVDSVVKVLDRYESELSAPLLLENPPIYFKIPGSSMCQVDFVREICSKSKVRLLLDLTHFYIASRNMGFDAFHDLERYPLDRVDEIHISGASEQQGVWWDDHACASCEEVFELLALAVRRATPQAITLEYNWSSRFPLDTVITDLERTRKTVCRS